MLRLFVAVLLAASTVADAALAHGGSAIGPCSPIGTIPNKDYESFAAPATATAPVKHIGKPMRRHDLRS